MCVWPSMRTRRAPWTAATMASAARAKTSAGSRVPLRSGTGAGAAPEHARPAGCRAVHVRRPAGHGDQCFEVLDLAPHRIRGSVAAVASTALVVVVHGELRGQFLRERSGFGPAGHPAGQDHGG